MLATQPNDAVLSLDQRRKKEDGQTHQQRQTVDNAPYEYAVGTIDGKLSTTRPTIVRVPGADLLVARHLKSFRDGHSQLTHGSKPERDPQSCVEMRRKTVTVRANTIPCVLPQTADERWDRDAADAAVVPWLLFGDSKLWR